MRLAPSVLGVSGAGSFLQLGEFLEVAHESAERARGRLAGGARLGLVLGHLLLDRFEPLLERSEKTLDDATCGRPPGCSAGRDGSGLPLAGPGGRRGDAAASQAQPPWCRNKSEFMGTIQVPRGGGTHVDAQETGEFMEQQLRSCRLQVAHHDKTILEKRFAVNAK